MLKVKCVYFIKRLLITALGFLMLALVESAPEFPFFYLSVVISCSVAIKYLWRSILKSERELRKRNQFRFSQKTQSKNYNRKAA